MRKIKFVQKIKKQGGATVKAHSHDGIECVIYLKADGVTDIDGRQYSITDGSVAIINAGVIHSEAHRNDADIVCFVSDFDGFYIPNGVYRPKNITDINKIALQILFESSTPKAFYNTMLSAKTDELMVCIMRDILSQGSSARLEECMQYIADNCTQDIDIRTLCKGYGIGYDSFRHKFKAIYGISPQSYLIYCRLKKANELLGNTDISCTDIALECGFCDSAQFCKMFKKQFGFTPTEYRKNIR